MTQINLNELVYIKGIGYGTLVDCPNKKSIRRVHSQPQSLDTIAPLFEESPSPNLCRQTSQVLTLPPDPSLLQISTIRLVHTQALVYTPCLSIQPTIKILVKTFIGNRQQLKLDIPVTSSIDQLKKLVFQKLRKDIGHFYHVRLFYPSVEMRELNKTMLLEQIPEMARLVLLAQYTFSLVVVPGALGLKLSRNNLCLTKTGDQNYSSAMANYCFESDGRYYWEIRLDNFAEQDDLYVGVAEKGINGQACPTHAGAYWGYMPLYAKKFSCEETGNLIDYGYAHKIGDVVGVLLTIKKGEGELTFYRGVMSCGKAFENIKVPVCPVFTLLGSPGSVIQITVDPRAAQPAYD